MRLQVCTVEDHRTRFFFVESTLIPVNSPAMPKDTLTITDNRTGKTYEVPIENGTIRTHALQADQGQ